MSQFANALDAIQQSKNRASNGGTFQPLNFFKMKSGETVTLRFITGFMPTVIYSCPTCGSAHMEIADQEYESYKSAGQTLVCPRCGAQIPESAIEGKRPGIIPAWLHAGMPVVVNGNQSWRTFLCLNEAPNNMDAAGHPIHPCPICAMTDNEGRRKNPSQKLTALAVVRRKVTEEVVSPTGQRVQKVVAVEDEMVENEDGQLVPHIVVVQQGIRNFFAALASFDAQCPIQYFDFDVTRNGGGIDTTYMFTPLTQADNPVIEPLDKYREFMPDIESYLLRQGTPAYYANFGYQVEGYIPEQPQQRQAAPAQPVVQAPQVAVPQGDAIPFSQVASQFGSYGGQ